MGHDIYRVVAIVLVTFEVLIGTRQTPPQLFDEDSVPILRKRCIEIAG